MTYHYSTFVNSFCIKRQIAEYILHFSLFGHEKDLQDYLLEIASPDLIKPPKLKMSLFMKS